MGLGLLLTCTIALLSCRQRPPLRENASAYILPEVPDFSHPVVDLPLKDGKFMRFRIRDCDVFPAVPGRDSCDPMIRPDAHPLPQACVREPLEFNGEFIQIEIGPQAMGAGGCCTSFAG